MYSLTRPAPETISRFISAQRDLPFSYQEVGASYSETPSDYTVDHNRVLLGRGPAVYEQAKAALRRWEMFNFPWVQLCWPEAPLEVGTTVAVLARALGGWSLNGCRIVYLLNEIAGEIYRFGFAYGTLPDHAERGEERFSIEWHRDNDQVWYDLLAFSRPNQLPAFLAYPYVRHLQRRFARASMQAMVRSINGTPFSTSLRKG